jgi:leucyl-tRNA synthetase
LCIELDGGVHEEEKVRQKDEEHSLFLEENRIKVLRFRNEEVEQGLDNVLVKIRVYINTCINRGCEGVQTPNPLT